MVESAIEPSGVRLSILNALLSNITPQLRRVTFGVDGDSIELQFLFEPSEDPELRELAEEVATLVVSDFVDARIRTSVEFSTDPIPASGMPDHVFLRRERGMFVDVPEPKIMFESGGNH